MLNVRDETRLKSITVGQPVNGTVKSAVTTKTAAWPWRYETAKYGSRDVRLDMLRGFCIFVMLVDHIGVFGPDSWLYGITGRGDFFISAAEGFVFISGLVMGMVYLRVIAKEGIGKATSKILNRVMKLYWLTVGITLFFTALANYTSLNIWAERDWIQIKDPIELIVGSLTLHNAFHGSSIMVMYVLFLALAPLAFWAMQQGKTHIVLGVSWLIWLGNIYYPNQFTIPFASNFPFAAWQTLFMTGLVIGYQKDKLANLGNEKLRGYYQIAIAGAAVLLLSFFIAQKNNLLGDIFPGVDFTGLLKDLGDKGALPWPRMLATLVMLQAFYLLTTWVWKPLDRAVGWLLVPLGEVALYSFTMHLAIIVIFYNVPGARDLPYFFYGFAMLGATMLLWTMVKTKFLFRIIPR